MRFKSTDGLRGCLGEDPASRMAEMVAPFGPKFAWFASCGYKPHTWQVLFHAMADPGERLKRWRHLVAGRRGGKTLSAAWETLFYCLHPEQYHWDFHGVRDDSPLWAWLLTKDYPTGFPALITLLQVMRQAGLVEGRDYKYNRGEKIITFANGSLLQFKTVGDDPQSLRGAGLHILWMDEAAFITDDEAWNVVRPALVDKKGCLMTTTTPKGRNWVWDHYFRPEVRDNDTRQGSVEYRSLDNPHLDPDEIEYERANMHPSLFKQEYEAMFDAMMGIELLGEWLHYYEDDHIKGVKLDKYLGVDPAVSLSDKADRFAMTLLGVDRKTGQAFILAQYAGRIPFPEQVDMIRDWWLEHQPIMIGVEIVAYQRALEQQVARIEGMPPVIGMAAPGKKVDRIMSMTPLFRAKRVRLLPYHRDFIDEWLSYDSKLKNPKDDVLDSCEIALRTAGVVLATPGEPTLTPSIANLDKPAASIDDLVSRELHALRKGDLTRVAHWDDEMGGDW